jgi:hypothetical protein
MIALLVGWLLAMALQWIIGFVGVVMFACLAVGIGVSVNFLYANYHRLSRRRALHRRRRYRE